MSYATVRDETAAIAETCQMLGCGYGIVPQIDEGEGADWLRNAAELSLKLAKL